MAYPLLQISDRGAVRHLTVNRPDKLNALDHATLEELTGAFTEAADCARCTRRCAERRRG